MTIISETVEQSNKEFTMPNSQRRIEYQWCVISLLFLLSVFLPLIIGMEGMEGGYGISFLSGFMVIVGLIVIIIYHGRANQMEKILKGEGKLAKWSYTPEEWMRFAAADYQDEKKAKKNLYLMVVAIGLIVGIVMTVILQSPVILVIVAGIFVLTAIPAFLVPRMRFRKLKHSEARALIAENGVIVGKMFHLWVKLGARLDQVSIDTDSEPNILEFAYSMPTRTGIQQEVARVPVPKGKMGEAAWIVQHFNSRSF